MKNNKLQNKTFEQLYNASENNIFNTFSETPIIFGCDKICFKFQCKVTIEKDKIKKYQELNPGTIRIYKDYIVKDKIARIIIKSDAFGKIIISGNNFNKSGLNDLTFSMIYGGFNLATSSINEINEKLKTNLEKIKNEIGIDIILPSLDDIVVKEIELATTFITSNKMPLNTRLLFIRTFSGMEQIDLTNFDINEESLDKHILAAKLGYNLKFNLYFKTAKAIQDEYLPQEAINKYNIYRLEVTLKKSRIKEFLGTNILGELTDDHLIRFFINQTKNGLENYIQRYERAVRETEDTIQKLYLEEGPKEYVEQFFLELSHRPMKNITTLMLDEETLIYIYPDFLVKNKNRSRTIKTLVNKIMKRSEKDNHPISTMSTWQTLIMYKFIWNLLNSFDGNIPNQPNRQRNSEIMKTIKMDSYSIECRNEEYKIIQSNWIKSSTIRKVQRDKWKKLDLSRLILTKRKKE